MAPYPFRTSGRAFRPITVTKLVLLDAHKVQNGRQQTGFACSYLMTTCRQPSTCFQPAWYVHMAMGIPSANLVDEEDASIIKQSAPTLRIEANLSKR